MKKIIKTLIILLIFIFRINVKAYESSIVDITSLSMEEIIDYLDKGIITSEKLVKLYLDRIYEYNKNYNAIISINNNILEEARYSDKLRKEGKSRGILEGIPIIIKDNIDVYGMPTTGGARALLDNYPKEDAIVIKRIKDNGGLIIAKANMSEFAFSAKDSYSSFGYVSNAFKYGYSSYGSSGGSAVAVALNFAPIAIGTDTNSSVRLPAQANGLVGFRPSTGLIDNKGIISYDKTRDTVGILSKTVSDNKILFKIISNSLLEDDNDNEIVIGIPNEFYIGNNNSYLDSNKETPLFIKEAMDELINKIQSNNIKIVYLDNIYNSKINNYRYNSIAGFTMCEAFNEYIKNTEGKIRSFSDLNKNNNKVQDLSGYNRACNYKESELNRAINNKNLLKDYISNIYKEYNLDYLMYPTTKNEVYKRGENYKLRNVSSSFSSTSGYPAITIPMVKYNDFYYGIELMGKEFEENKLYNISSIIEKLINIKVVNNNIKNLYEVNESDKELVNLYLNSNNIIWNEKVKEYFINNKGNSEELIKEYNKDDISEVKNIIVEEHDNFDINIIVSLLCIFIIILPIYCKKIKKLY